jgi:hypothetical protein
MASAGMWFITAAAPLFFHTLLTFSDTKNSFTFVTGINFFWISCKLPVPPALGIVDYFCSKSKVH